MNRFVIADSTVCIGCRTCEAACSETHRQHGPQAIPRLQVLRNETESATPMCPHHKDTHFTPDTPIFANPRTHGAAPLTATLF